MNNQRALWIWKGSDRIIKFVNGYKWVDKKTNISQKWVIRCIWTGEDRFIGKTDRLGGGGRFVEGVT